MIMSVQEASNSAAEPTRHADGDVVSRVRIFSAKTYM